MSIEARDITQPGGRLVTIPLPVEGEAGAEALVGPVGGGARAELAAAADVVIPLDLRVAVEEPVEAQGHFVDLAAVDAVVTQVVVRVAGADLPGPHAEGVAGV